MSCVVAILVELGLESTQGYEAVRPTHNHKRTKSAVVYQIKEEEKRK